MLKAFKYFILLFFTTISLVTLSSCNDDSDDASSDIIGRWRYIHYSGWEKEQGRIVDSWDEDVDEDQDPFVYNFKKNGEITFGLEDDFHDRARGFWKIDGKKIYIDFPDEISEWWDIKTLTSSRLVISQLDKDGTNEYYYEYTFSKEK